MSFEIFIDKANKEMASVSHDYMFNRKYSKDTHGNILHQANERMFKAIKERDFFIDMFNKAHIEKEPKY